MPRTINVFFLPAEFQPEDLLGGTAVIVDVLRASTSISAALANGASYVKPCLGVDEAFQYRELSTTEVLLGGERGGLRIEGFDLTNSPTDYSASCVKGRVIAFTTTNGTKALVRAKRSQHVVVGAFVNLSRVADFLLKADTSVNIVCAGTDGSVTGEDVLFAGALADRLQAEGRDSFTLSDSARIALNFWQSECPDASFDQIHTVIRESQGGRNLIRLGFDADIAFAASVDRVPALGCLAGDGTLRAPR